MSAKGEAIPSHEFQANLMDKDGLLVPSVTVRLSPTIGFGEFRLPPSTDVHLILAKATSLQMSDERRLELLNLRLCNAAHSIVDARSPHFEFDYKTN
jgi:hypothetical protein